MKTTRYGFGSLALAYIALLLQFLVPHHHHQQATFLFLDSCPTTHSETMHDEHDHCHHPHSENSECSVLDHVVTTHKKQDAFRGHTALDSPPILPLLFIIDLPIPIVDNTPKTLHDPPLLYESIAHVTLSLRGPPACA